MKTHGVRAFAITATTALVLPVLVTLPAAAASQTQAQQSNQQQASDQSGGQQSNSPLNLDQGQIKQVQQALDQKGFRAGRPDGLYGPETRQAVRSFQQNQKLGGNGQVDEQTLAALGVSQQPGRNAQPATDQSSMNGQPGNSQANENPQPSSGQGAHNAK
jgi:peptidoglycan hydrolase-like protein with peptidoglycan-binding domain